MEYLKKIWIAGGFLFIFAVVFMSLAPTGHSQAALDKLPSLGRLPFDFFFGPDKAIHMAVYFLMILWFVPVTGRRGLFSLAFHFSILGAVVEGMQGMTGYREASGTDLIANLAGIAAAFCAGQMRFSSGLTVVRFYLGLEAGAACPSDRI